MARTPLRGAQPRPRQVADAQDAGDHAAGQADRVANPASDRRRVTGDDVRIVPGGSSRPPKAPGGCLRWLSVNLGPGGVGSLSRRPTGTHRGGLRLRPASVRCLLSRRQLDVFEVQRRHRCLQPRARGTEQGTRNVARQLYIVSRFQRYAVEKRPFSDGSETSACASAGPSPATTRRARPRFGQARRHGTRSQDAARAHAPPATGR